MNSSTQDSSNICHWGKAEVKTWIRTAQRSQAQQKEQHDARQGKRLSERGLMPACIPDS